VGCYYITKIREGFKGEGKIFSNEEEAVLAYNNRFVHIQTKIKVRINQNILETSVGRILFNRVLPKELGYRNEAFDKKRLQALVREVYRLEGTQRTAELIDEIKRLGFTYMKQSGLSWGMDDLLVPQEKYDLLTTADEEVQSTYDQYREGLLTEEERKTGQDRRIC
jgi:DNA-directed RNA polymerase subunit beta'